MSDTAWTDARVEALTSLWREGLSASQVAERLGGVTRNAVIGKIHRLALSGRAPGGTVQRHPRAARVIRAIFPPRAVASRIAPHRRAAVAVNPIEVVPEGPGLIGDLVALSAHVCRWPIGDPSAPDFSFCGRATAGEGPYCADHHRCAHQTRALSPLDRDPFVRRVLAGLAA